jgi:integrase
MWFFTGPDGKQIPTGVADPADEAGAVEARKKIIEEMAAAVAAKLAPVAPPARAARTVADAVPAYLARKRGEISAGAHRAYSFALDTHFKAAFGGRPVPTLVAEEIESWAGGFGWSRSYRHNTLGAVASFLKWAGHPLALKKPPKEGRGSEAVLTDEQFAAVLAAYDPRYGGGDFRELLRVLRETGARPQEVARLTAQAVDWGNRSATLREHKTAGKGGVRIIHFSEAAFAVLAAQKEKHRAGPLFRTRCGRAYSGKAIVQQMQRISKRVGFRAFAYGLGRHSFATKALVAGVPDTVVAALLGHKSTKMVHSNYGHVSEQSRALKEAVEKVSKRPG